MNPFSRREWKKAAYKQASNPQGGLAWFIVGLLIVLAALTTW